MSGVCNNVARLLIILLSAMPVKLNWVHRRCNELRRCFLKNFLSGCHNSSKLTDQRIAFCYYFVTSLNHFWYSRVLISPLSLLTLWHMGIGCSLVAWKFLYSCLPGKQRMVFSSSRSSRIWSYVYLWQNVPDTSPDTIYPGFRL